MVATLKEKVNYDSYSILFLADLNVKFELSLMHHDFHAKRFTGSRQGEDHQCDGTNEDLCSTSGLEQRLC